MTLLAMFIADTFFHLNNFNPPEKISGLYTSLFFNEDDVSP